MGFFGREYRVVKFLMVRRGKLSLGVLVYSWKIKLNLFFYIGFSYFVNFSILFLYWGRYGLVGSVILRVFFREVVFFLILF